MQKPQCCCGNPAATVARSSTRSLMLFLRLEKQGSKQQFSRCKWVKISCCCLDVSNRNFLEKRLRCLVLSLESREEVLIIYNMASFQKKRCLLLLQQQSWGSFLRYLLKRSNVFNPGSSLITFFMKSHSLDVSSTNCIRPGASGCNSTQMEERLLDFSFSAAMVSTLDSVMSSGGPLEFKWFVEVELSMLISGSPGQKEIRLTPAKEQTPSLIQSFSSSAF